MSESISRSHENDLISRQAAIDATWFEPSYTDPLNVLTEVRDRLKALPSAQDIIKCKDCDWWTKQEDSLQGRCDRYGMYPTGYWYCAAARERREDG